MSKSIYAGLAATAASLLLAACGGSAYSTGGSTAKPARKAASASASASAKAPSGAATVATASNAALGAKILTDAGGMTLYRLSAETGGRFVCTSQSCLSVWHPLRAPAGAAPSGVPRLGTVKRPDGTEQVTYRGAPLYTFASDTAPGETNGEGIRDVGTWSVVTIGSGAASTGTGTSTSAPAAATGGESSGASPSGGAGYSY